MYTQLIASLPPDAMAISVAGKDERPYPTNCIVIPDVMSISTARKDERPCTILRCTPTNSISKPCAAILVGLVFNYYFRIKIFVVIDFFSYNFDTFVLLKKIIVNVKKLNDT